MAIDKDAFDKAVPGFANFMEDTDVSVDVEVGDPEEVVEETTEAAETAEEATEVEAEAEASDEQVEMVCRGFDELERLEAHIKQYGLSRDFVAWYNYDGRLAAMCNMAMPALESIDSTADPHSSFAIACQEGIGASIKEAAVKVWEFIKKVMGNIWNFMKRAWEFIVNLVIGTKRNAERLKKAWQAREDDAQQAAQREGTFSTLGELNEMAKACSGDLTSKAEKATETIWSGIVRFFTSATKETQQEAAYNSGIAEFTKSIDNANSIIEGKLKANSSSKKRKISDCAWNDVPKLCDLALQLMNNSEAMKKTIKKNMDESEKARKEAEKKAKESASSSEEKKNISKNAREAARDASKLSKNLMKVINFQRKVAGQCIKTASLRISSGSKKKGGGESK